MSKIYWSWKNIPGSLKRIWQNLTRGWNDSDLWSFDHTISMFILPRMRRFKEIVHGHPCFVTDSLEEEKYDDDMKKWLEIIDKMIYAFEGVAFRLDDIEIKDAGGKLEFKDIEKKDDPENEFVGCSTLEYVSTPEQKELHDQYIKDYRKECDIELVKIKEGLELFTKYFLNLWD